ncbi:MAG: hypothetical protein H6573_21250 [Lewinellaceae bacterium]|nr:hypothetical protein [Lewinellaceae bacterium]
MKFGHLLLLSFFITLNGSILQAQWASLGSGITASPRAIGGIAPADENVIWGFTWHANSFVPTHEFTRTVDGGQTWQAGTLTGVEVPVSDLHFPSTARRPGSLPPMSKTPSPGEFTKPSMAAVRGCIRARALQDSTRRPPESISGMK